MRRLDYSRYATSIRWLVLILALVSGGCAYAQSTECAQPDGDHIIKALKLDVSYVSTEQLAITEYKGYKLQWISVSWSGPVGGELVVMDCNGHLLAGIEAGSVDSGKEVSIGGYPYPVLRTRAQTLSGTDQAHAYTDALFAFNGKKIVSLFSQESEIYGFQLCSDATIENYDIAASADWHTITVIGIRKRQHGKIVNGECSEENWVTKTVKLPTKHFCWNGKRYVRSKAAC